MCSCALVDVYALKRRRDKREGHACSSVRTVEVMSCVRMVWQLRAEIRSGDELKEELRK